MTQKGTIDDDAFVWIQPFRERSVISHYVVGTGTWRSDPRYSFREAREAALALVAKISRDHARAN